MSAPIDIPHRKTSTESSRGIDDFEPGSPPQHIPGPWTILSQQLSRHPGHHYTPSSSPHSKSSSFSQTMDEFAQSREDDDLFADEFEPISDPVTVIEEPKPSVKSTTAAPTFSSTPTQPTNNVRQDHGQERRGRGSRGGRGGLGASRYADSAPAAAPPVQAANSITVPVTEHSTPQSTVSALDNGPALTEPTPSGRTPAVRGDRSATGGPAHKKLTEEELTAKMAKMAVINAEKAERHRLSEADQAAYQHREKELAKEKREKAVAEKKNERVMEMERAKNRERKMKAQGGREWDSEKVETDIVDGRGRGRSSEYVRGGHGGVIRGRGGLAESRFSGPEEVEEPERGSRGPVGLTSRARGRGGRGRGGKSSAPTVPSSEDFPSLPTPAKVSSDAAVEGVKSPTGEKGPGDWAEEMATPIEEKKMDV